MTPREIVARVLEAELGRDMDAFSDLIAEDGVLEMPYAPPGARRIEGRETIRARLRKGVELSPLRLEGAVREEVYETSDPEVVIREMELHGTVVASGAAFRAEYVTLFRIRDGLIALCRHYAEPADRIVASARNA